MAPMALGANGTWWCAISSALMAHVLGAVAPRAIGFDSYFGAFRTSVIHQLLAPMALGANGTWWCAISSALMAHVLGAAAPRGLPT